MIDLHCHILPGIDDGAADEAESLEMMKMAIKDGITIIAATPHHKNGQFSNESKVILSGVKRLNELAEAKNLKIKIVPGQEIRINGEIEEDYKMQKLVTLGGNTRYILVEFSSRHVPRYTERLFYEIQFQGLKPIIVHPERNTELMENPEKLIGFIEKGAFVQVTAASVTGCFGKKIQKFTNQLIEANGVHIIASDAHNTTSRGFQMKAAFETLERKYSIDYVHFLQTNAQAILNDKLIYSTQLKQVKRKRILGIFS